MQSTFVAALAETFLDDAVALIAGAGRFAADLVLDGLRTMREAAFAPIDRIARTCDVAGVLDARGRTARPRLSRAETLAARYRNEKGGPFSFFRVLRHLS